METLPAMSDGTLTVEIKNTRPVELIEFTKAFYALGDQYTRHLQSLGQPATGDAKLHIQEIRTGSIIATLQDNLPYVIPFVEHISTIISFAEKLKKVTGWLAEKEAKPDTGITVPELKNISSILKPVASDNGAQIFISGTNNTVQVTMNYDMAEAHKIQNNAIKEIALIQAPNIEIQEKVLFYWDTAKNDIKGTSADKGKIDSISSKALKVIFPNDAVKQNMIDTEGNFFHLAFSVDVEVQTINNLPAAYKILNVHDSFPKEEY